MLATRPASDTIAVTHTFDGIEAAAHRIIAQSGGMPSIIKGAKVVVLKPNFVAGRAAETGAATCPLPDVINRNTLTVNHKSCHRCLLCYSVSWYYKHHYLDR